MVFYGTIQLIKLFNFGEPAIMESVRDSYFDTDHIFSSDEGLMVAFGLTAYDSNTEPIEDPTYGKLRAYYKTWGLEDTNANINEEI